MDLTTDRLLLLQAQNGDLDAVEQLVTIHSPWAIRLAHSRLHDYGTAEDAVQEAWIQALSRLRQCRGEHGFGPWFSTVVVRIVLRWSRPRKHMPPGDGVQSALRASPEHDVDARLDTWRYLTQLTHKQRQVLILRYFYDLEIKEIAAVLHCPLGTIKSRLSAAQQAFSRRWTFDEASTGREPKHGLTEK